MNTNIILANTILIFHILVVLLFIIVPFSGIPYLLLLHFVFGMSLITHWLANNNTCSLSTMESYFRGIPYDKGFFHQFIAPLYEFNGGSKLSANHLSTWIYIITISLMIISLVSLLYSKKWSEIRECYNKYKQDLTPSELYYKCYLMLFN